jgi:hypothetical protein
LLERLESVGGSDDWGTATDWLMPAKNTIARAFFFMNDIT